MGVSPNLLKRWNGENWVTTGAAATGSTPGQIRDKLQTLIGVDRLHATAVQGLFSGSWRDLADKPVLGVTVRDGGTVDGEGIRILDFGANLTVTVANGIATIAGHAQGHAASVHAV